MVGNSKKRCAPEAALAVIVPPAALPALWLVAELCEVPPGLASALVTAPAAFLGDFFGSLAGLFPLWAPAFVLSAPGSPGSTIPASAPASASNASAIAPLLPSPPAEPPTAAGIVSNGRPGKQQKSGKKQNKENEPRG